jgi:hypothetical protein
MESTANADVTPATANMAATTKSSAAPAVASGPASVG